VHAAADADSGDEGKERLLKTIMGDLQAMSGKPPELGLGRKFQAKSSGWDEN
jgi:hypothetical protein